MVHHGQHVVVGERLPAHGHHRDVSLGRVKPADVVVLAEVALVGVLRLGDNPEEGGVGVGQGLNRATAATGASTLQRVGGTAAMRQILCVNIIKACYFVLRYLTMCWGESSKRSWSMLLILA